MSNYGGDKLSKRIKYNDSGMRVEQKISVFDRKKFNIGTKYINYVGQIATIIDYKGAFDVIIRFDNTGSIKSVRMDHLREGAFIDNEIDTNVIYGNKETGNLYRVVVKGPYKSEIEFIDGSTPNMIFDNADIVSNKIISPYKINAYGGYFGEGPYKYDEKIVSIWRLILLRTKNPYKPYTEFKDYQNCWVSEEWRNYQYFAHWYINQYKDLNKNFMYNIDKDYKQIGQKIKFYSKDTCMLIPKELNMLIRCIYNDSDIPIGVSKSGNKYYVNAFGYEDSKSMSFKYAEEAFEYFKMYKLRQIHEYADYFYSNGALHKKDYDMLYKFEILPFGN